MLKALKRDFDERVKKHTQQCRLNYYASKIQHKYLRYHIRTYSLIDLKSGCSNSKEHLSLTASNRKMVNKLRNALNISAMLKHAQANTRASHTMLKFLAAFHRLQNWKRQAISIIDKCRKIRTRGKLIFCQNRVRMSILRQLWNDQKSTMITNLNKQKSKKKAATLRNKRIGDLIQISDEIRE